MKFDKKTTEKHKAAIRKLIAMNGLRATMKQEIQWELRKKYDLEFDLDYIHRLLGEIQEDREREIAYLATPEGQRNFMREYERNTAKIKRLEKKILSREN